MIQAAKYMYQCWSMQQQPKEKKYDIGRIHIHICTLRVHVQELKCMCMYDKSDGTDGLTRPDLKPLARPNLSRVSARPFMHVQVCQPGPAGAR